MAMDSVIHHTPQLVLHRELENLPEVELPEGYNIRHYQPGDKTAWDNIIRDSFQNNNWDFNKGMRKDYAFRPERVIFVCYGDEPVATASAWYKPEWGKDTGYIHMVGTISSHTGKGLGYQATLAALYRMVDEGRKSVVLTTDDFRIPALKTYIKLGFKPLLIHENQRERWKDVFRTIGKPQLIEVYENILNGSLMSRELPRSDSDKPENYSTRYQWYIDREERCGTGRIDALGDESFYKPSLLGYASVEPENIIAGSRSNLRFTYKAGPGGLSEGSGVLFYMCGQHPLQRGKEKMEVTVSGPSHCEIEAVNMGFRIIRGSLNEGDVVIISAGLAGTAGTMGSVGLAGTARSAGLAGLAEMAGSAGEEDGFIWTPLADRYEFKVLINTGKGEPVKRLPEPLIINVLPEKLYKLEAIVPCTTRGDKLKVHITARDIFDNRVPLSGEVIISNETAEARAHLISGIADSLISVNENKVSRINVRHPESGLMCTANPSIPSNSDNDNDDNDNDDNEFNLYIGDLHAHDFMSAAHGYTDKVYKWGMEDRNLDFLSVSVQNHGWINNQKWTIAKYMNERYLNEKEFVTFLGVEWQHTGYGDKVIHFLGGDQPYFCTDDNRYNSTAKLYEAARASDALIISHHSSYPKGSWCSATDFDVVETDVERLTELWSMHGSSEGYDPNDRPLRSVDPENNVMAALRRGIRLGFVAGSDTHSGRPGGSLKEPAAGYFGGLAAVWAKSLTRRDVFEALKARRTYALTGARIALKMTVNGAIMGSEIDASEKADIRIDVWAPGKIKIVQIMKNTCVMREYEPDNDEFHVQYEDITQGPAFYHCRVTQADGHLAVCSPVWVG